MNLEIQEVAKILKSKVSPRAAVCRGYSLDSRNVRPNELFFAITGPNFDGHDFVASAIKTGEQWEQLCQGIASNPILNLFDRCCLILQIQYVPFKN